MNLSFSLLLSLLLLLLDSIFVPAKRRRSSYAVPYPFSKGKNIHVQARPLQHRRDIAKGVKYARTSHETEPRAAVTRHVLGLLARPVSITSRASLVPSPGLGSCELSFWTPMARSPCYFSFRVGGGRFQFGH
jgi:hypothetical protein